MNNKSTWIGIGALVLAIAGGVWAFNQRENPDVVAAREVNKKMAEAFSDENISSEDKMKLYEESRKANEKLSDDERNKVRREAWKGRGKQMEATIDDYLALDNEKDRNAFLDEQIEKWQGMREQWKGMKKKREAEAKAEGKKPEDRAGRGGWSPPKPGDKEGAMNMQRRMMDKTSPEQRAKFSEYFMALKQRMEDRGMDTGWGR